MAQNYYNDSEDENDNENENENTDNNYGDDEINNLRNKLDDKDHQIDNLYFDYRWIEFKYALLKYALGFTICLSVNKFIMSTLKYL